MRIVPRYLSIEFLKVLALLTVALVSIFLVIDFFERIDDFLESHVAWSKTILYFLFKIPFIVVQMAPAAVLMGIFVSLGLLFRHNEITALRANGFGPDRIFAPFLMTAVLVTVLSFIISEEFVPYFHSKVSEIWNVEVKKKPMGVMRHEKIWYRGYHSIYNVQVVNLKNKTMQGITIHKFDRNFNLVQRVDAKYVEWIDESWHFYDGVIKTIDPDGSARMETFESKVISLPEKMEDFCFVEKTPEEMSYSELKAYIGRVQKEGYDATSYLPDMYAKLSFPCVSVIMSVIGFIIIWRMGRYRSIALGITIGIGIGFMYWVIHALAISLGHAGIFPPFIAAWTANLIFGLPALAIIPRLS